jgi:HEPN domain-containing protein
MNNGKITSLTEPPDKPKTKSEAREDFYADYNVSLAFYQKALQCYHKQDLFIATFMMQQSVQFTCYALIKAFTGLKVKTEYIKDIIEHLQGYVPKIKNIFPCDTEKECILFWHLENADISPMYVTEFEITEEEALQLLNRIAELQRLAKEVFVTKFSF